MSLVIGMKVANAVVFGCDGFALLENKRDGSITKLETCTKLAVLDKWSLVLGYVGETEALIGIVSGAHSPHSPIDLERGYLNTENLHLTEQEFLDHMGNELGRLHSRRRKTHLVLVCGYIAPDGRPVLHCFNRNGSRRLISEFVCIGSGARLASDRLAKGYRFDMSIEKAATVIIDAVYKASVVPTVNALPMLVIATSSGVHDFRAITMKMHKDFKRNLRLSLVQQATCISRTSRGLQKR